MLHSFPLTTLVFLSFPALLLTADSFRHLPLFVSLLKRLFSVPLWDVCSSIRLWTRSLLVAVHMPLCYVLLALSEGDPSLHVLLLCRFFFATPAVVSNVTLAWIDSIGLGGCKIEDLWAGDTPVPLAEATVPRNETVWRQHCSLDFGTLKPIWCGGSEASVLPECRYYDRGPTINHPLSVSALHLGAAQVLSIALSAGCHNSPQNNNYSSFNSLILGAILSLFVCLFVVVF